MKKLSAILIALVLSAGSAYGQAWNGTTFRDGYPLHASDLNSALGALPLPGGSTAQGPLHMGGNLIDGLTSLGLASNDTPPSTPGSGGELYTDTSNILHYLAPSINGSAISAPGFATGIVTTTAADAQPLNNLVYVANMTGGTPGFVVQNLRIQTNVNGNVGNYLWGISSILNSTASSGEHVAVAGTANKNGTAEVWAGLDMANDQLGGASSVDGAMVGRELDMSANGADDGGAAHGSVPSGQGIRVGMDMVGTHYGTGSNATIGWGYRVSGLTDATFQRAFAVNAQVSIAAFDTEYATLSNGADAYRMAAGQTLSFNSGNHDLSYNGAGTLQYKPNGSTTVLSVDDSGNVSAGASVTVGDFLKLKSKTVAQLPTCNAGAQAEVYWVSDATSPTWNGTLTGGGSTQVTAICNGVSWTAH